MTAQACIVAYLGLGSNMNHPKAQLERAVEAIERLPATRIIRKSPLYASKPWGKLDQPDFLNMVVEIETGLSSHTLLQQCKRIEAEQGRKEGERWGPRPVDIDILLFGDKAIRTAGLVVPHPRMWERAFVLLPLANLRPDIVSPGGMAIVDALHQLHIASQEVWLYEPAREPVINEA